MMASSSALKLKNPTDRRVRSSSKRLPTLEGLERSQLLLKNRGRPLPLFAQLDGYQKHAVEFSSIRSGTALFFEQGTGKTWIALGLIEYLDVDHALLVVPLSNIESTWGKTIRAQLPQYTICRSWKEFKACKDAKRILLVHYEGLSPFINQMKRFAFNLVIFDESQRLKNRSSGLSRLAKRFRHHERRVALSGTPMDKSPIEVWAQMRFVDHTIFGDTWSKDPDDFGNKYCYRGGFMGKQYIFRTGSGKKSFKHKRSDPDIFDSVDMMPEYLERLKVAALRVEKKDVMEGNPPIITEVPVMLLGEQAQLYEQMDATGVIRVDGQRIMCDMEGVKRMKLQQITGGFIFDENSEIIPVGKAKERKLNSLIVKIKKEFNSPVVVFCRYREEMEIVKRVLKKHYKRIGEIHGGIKDKKRTKARTDVQDQFQAGKLDAVILQQKTGGVGIDLFHGHVAIFYSFSHSWIDFDQACARLDRRGQKNQVYIFLMIAQNTIDEDKLLAINSKCSLTQAILRNLKRR